MGLLRRRVSTEPPERQLAEHQRALAGSQALYRPQRRPLSLPAATDPVRVDAAGHTPAGRLPRSGSTAVESPLEITAPLPAVVEPGLRSFPVASYLGHDGRPPGRELQVPSLRREGRPLGTADHGRHARVEPDPEPHERAVENGEAIALAWAFALDLESWDEEHPERRAAVLARYLPGVRTATLGWDGLGRQRAETAVCGLVTRLDDTHVSVDVRVRVTPYVRVQQVVWPLHPPPEHVPDGRAVPAAAPSPVAPGWAACDSEWKRLRIPITRNRDGGLAVDLGQSSDRSGATRQAGQDKRGAC
ncbi:hypothetical protein [Pseudonocardia sp. WMMC193]|uniref:hypothetical protein n=1 Tax=Pseudonocardia sp. WMMC193 TaxID=2911965 RepID=UPI001F220BB7|nr:hypothetical protein [Pseudonocardia sp. WMMC193]MCF7552569.1 hypothetical protein [Pseudonocardia sp. WMMC193]